MSPAGADAVLIEEPVMSPAVVTANDAASHVSHHDQFVPTPLFREGTTARRRTPRKSLIVVLPENHVVPANLVSEHLSTETGSEEIDVILACAGQPTGISSLQRRVRDLQVLLAPAGTSDEDLRELAMHQASGDIVTLLCGARLGG